MRPEISLLEILKRLLNLKRLEDKLLPRNVWPLNDLPVPFSVPVPNTVASCTLREACDVALSSVEPIKSRSKRKERFCSFVSPQICPKTEAGKAADLVKRWLWKICESSFGSVISTGTGIQKRLEHVAACRNLLIQAPYLFNMYISRAVTGAVAMAMANKVIASACNAGNTPFQIRLAYYGDTGMSVSWNTNKQLIAPSVEYGPNGLNLIASSSESVTYPTSSTWNNHVTITGLSPDTLYYYKPYCGTTAYHFFTSKSAGKSGEFKFAMVGDLGTMGPDGLGTTVGKGGLTHLAPGELNTIDSLISLKSEYEFVWHVGDIAYADAWLKEETSGYISPLNQSDGGAEYDKILNEFYVQISPITQDRAYMVGPGNHEANCDNGSNLGICLPGQLNFTGYRKHWNMPSGNSGGVENFWYSWDYGMVHFIQFNTETDFPNAPDEPGGEGAENAGPFAPSGAQLAWLKNDLASVDRSKTPWVVAGGHRPWYVSTTECTECQAAFEPIFLQYGVDLVLHGHKHFYERESAIANGVAQEIEQNPTAPWYIVSGAAGHYDGLDVPTLPLVPTSRKNIYTTYGWNLFTVHNCTHLTTQYIASNNNSVLDTATLYKNRTCKLN